ncbi:GFA family protein [Brevundimonas sp.]|uniref:GFA family protein n=1 Tax=Brevundimonas sp. TaxID=1871086 RepID=UPI00289C5D35|nr:GFA family protein [Brevundimonas sp.]
MSDAKLEGGCNCGAVRYSVGGKTLGVAACHCTSCRKQSGSAYSVNLVVLSNAMEVTGELSSYIDNDTESGKPVVREFCGQCGSPIRSRPEATPQIAVVKVGTLDAPAAFAPKVHIWTRSAVPWAAIPEDAIRFEKGPPS